MQSSVRGSPSTSEKIAISTRAFGGFTALSVRCAPLPSPVLATRASKALEGLTARPVRCFRRFGLQSLAARIREGPGRASAIGKVRQVKTSFLSDLRLAKS